MIHVMPKPAGQDCDDTFLWVNDFVCIVVDDMTVLIACIDHDDVLLAADGRGSIAGIAKNEKDIKTIRVNSDLAIGVSGGAYHASLVLASILGRPELEQNEQFMRFWEENEFSAERISFSDVEDGVKARIPEIEQDPRWRIHRQQMGERLKLSAILVGGIDKGVKRILMLQALEDGKVCVNKHERCLPVGPDLSPDQKRECLNRLFGQREIKDRLIDTIRYCADINEVVNKNVSIRRMSTKPPFSLEWFLEEAVSS